MLNKFYIEPVLFKTNNLSHVKFIHSTNFLLMDNPNTQSNTDNIPEVDTTKMLNGLDEIIKNSDSKTVSDIISERETLEVSRVVRDSAWLLPGALLV